MKFIKENCMRNKTKQEMVEEFHETFGRPVRESFFQYRQEKDKREYWLRIKLIKEELQELEDALSDEDQVETLDAVVDILYLVYGAALQFGFSEELIDAAFKEVHTSNMSKLDEEGKPIYREDGKILKGPNYFKPNIKKLIRKFSVI